MSLDVYVGSLTRYFCGDWETVVQKWARETGVPVRVVGRGDSSDAVTDPNEILRVVLHWREGLSGSLQKAGGPALEWDERLEAPYFTDRPAWDAFGDLLLWAAHDEQPQMSRPLESVKNWPDDPAYRAANTGHTRYPSLLRGVEVWLPVDFPFTFAAEWVTGDKLAFGSSASLLRELRDLNSRTWRVDDDRLPDWRREGKESGGLLETGARFAFGILWELANRAAEHRLVMKLDY